MFIYLLRSYIIILLVQVDSCEEIVWKMGKECWSMEFRILPLHISAQKIYSQA